MAVPRWEPRVEVTPQEAFLLKRLGRVKKLFGFLRQYRREIFDDEMQSALAEGYRDTGAGSIPVPPAQLAMVLLLQAYTGVSDAEAVELTVVDLRWQMVLDCLGAAKPAFGQGTLQAFRQRFIEHDLDKKLLAHTREVASRTGAYDGKKLPKAIRVAMDSAPFEGAGRVEDTINLLGHAMRKLVQAIAVQVGRSCDDVAREAGVPVLLASSVKAGLDRDWTQPGATDEALAELCTQMGSLTVWLQKRDAMELLPLLPHIAALKQVEVQDVSRENGKVSVKEGVAADRRVSIEDKEMRHGRKSQSRLFNGYKRHVGVDLQTGLIVAATLTPANQAEQSAAQVMAEEMTAAGLEIDGLNVDLGYLASPLVAALEARGKQVMCRPRRQFRRNGHFCKTDFDINLRTRRATCPAGEEQRFTLGTTVRFTGCATCTLRAQCTASAAGRTLSIAADEPLQKRLRANQATRAGRKALRERTTVEHRLAHLAAKQRRRARYRGIRLNTFDTRRHATVLNLEMIHLHAATRASTRSAF